MSVDDVKTTIECNGEVIGKQSTSMLMERSTLPVDEEGGMQPFQELHQMRAMRVCLDVNNRDYELMLPTGEVGRVLVGMSDDERRDVLEAERLHFNLRWRLFTIDLCRGLARGDDGQNAEWVAGNRELQQIIDSFRDGVEKAMVHGYLGVVRMMMDYGGFDEPDWQELLKTCCINGGPPASLEYAVRMGADVAEKNNRAMVFAAVGGNIPAMRWLSEHGGDLRAREGTENSRGEPEHGLIGQACGNGRVDAVAWLYERGVELFEQFDSLVERSLKLKKRDMFEWLMTLAASVSREVVVPVGVALEKGGMDLLEYLQETGQLSDRDRGVVFTRGVSEGDMGMMLWAWQKRVYIGLESVFRAAEKAFIEGHSDVFHFVYEKLAAKYPYTHLSVSGIVHWTTQETAQPLEQKLRVLETIKYLVDNCGLDLKSNHQGVLRAAIWANNIPLMEYVVGMFPDDEEMFATKIDDAYRYNRYDAIMWLRRNGFNACLRNNYDAKQCLQQAYADARWDFVDWEEARGTVMNIHAISAVSRSKAGARVEFGQILNVNHFVIF